MNPIALRAGKMSYNSTQIFLFMGYEAVQVKRGDLFANNAVRAVQVRYVTVLVLVLVVRASSSSSANEQITPVRGDGALYYCDD